MTAIRPKVARLTSRIQNTKLNHQEMEHDSTNCEFAFERQINYQRGRPISAGGIPQFDSQGEIHEQAGYPDGGKPGDGAGVVAPYEGLPQGAEDMTLQNTMMRKRRRLCLCCLRHSIATNNSGFEEAPKRIKEQVT